MTTKQPCDKLKITKNQRIVDASNLYTYKFEWMNGDNIIYSEIRKIDTDEMNLPRETYLIDELVDHKINCCLDIDKSTFTVEEVNV
jgi:hypothetical protein